MSDHPGIRELSALRQETIDQAETIRARDAEIARLKATPPPAPPFPPERAEDDLCGDDCCGDDCCGDCVKWSARLAAASSALETMRARVGVLEGALRGLLKHMGPGGYIPGAGEPATRAAQAALAPAPPTDAPQSTLPCGCVTCVCHGDGDRCWGCGAREAEACQRSRLSGGPRHVAPAAAPDATPEDAP